MAYKNEAGLGVSNHYGPRAVGGEKGSYTTQDGRRIYTVDVPLADGLAQVVPVPAGALVENVDLIGAVTLTSLTVDAVDISAAVWGTPVSVPLGGELEAVATGEGKIVITVTHVAY
jgi:hypothetical protein